MIARAAAVAAGLLAASALAAPAALADGDPASDVLITQRVFFPYAVKLLPASTKALTRTVAEAERQGYPVRVALIGNDFDLGAVGVLWRKPKPYAKLLAQELAGFNTDWVLAVMPNGYGVYRCVGVERAGGYEDPCEAGEPVAADESALRALPTSEASGDDLAVAAAGAVRRLAALHGSDLREEGGRGPAMIVAGALLVLTFGAALVVLFRRSRVTRVGVSQPE